jgi:hypothetical protein
MRSDVLDDCLSRRAICLFILCLSCILRGFYSGCKGLPVTLQSALGRDDLLLKKSPNLLQLEQKSHAADQRCILISDGT